jgi:hypothetical protein
VLRRSHEGGAQGPRTWYIGLCSCWVMLCDVSLAFPHFPVTAALTKTFRPKRTLQPLPAPPSSFSYHPGHHCCTTDPNGSEPSWGKRDFHPEHVLAPQNAPAPTLTSSIPLKTMERQIQARRGLSQSPATRLQKAHRASPRGKYLSCCRRCPAAHIAVPLFQPSESAAAHEMPRQIGISLTTSAAPSRPQGCSQWWALWVCSRPPKCARLMPSTPCSLRRPQPCLR